MLFVILLGALAHASAGPPDLRAADARLNAQYRATMAEMRRRDADAAPTAAGASPAPGYAQALLAAQRAWIAYRDANCLSAGYEYRGGSAERLSRAVCLVRMTDDRTRELRLIRRGASPD